MTWGVVLFCLGAAWGGWLTSRQHRCPAAPRAYNIRSIADRCIVVEYVWRPVGMTEEPLQALVLALQHAADERAKKDETPPR